MIYLKSIFYFILAGLLEIGGGYLVWLWLRESKSWVYGLSGMVMLALYGFIPTLQPAHFGRVYAAYGGVFIILSMLWGMESGRHQTGCLRFNRSAASPGRCCHHDVLATGLVKTYAIRNI